MTWFERHFFRDFHEDYPKYCFEYLPDEWQRLRRPGNGRTGVEAFIAADEYEKHIQSENHMPFDYTFEALTEPRESHFSVRCTKCKRTWVAFPHHQPGNPGTFVWSPTGAWITCITHNCVSRFVGLSDMIASAKGNTPTS